jgi:hypothetical protein
METTSLSSSYLGGYQHDQDCLGIPTQRQPIVENNRYWWDVSITKICLLAKNRHDGSKDPGKGKANSRAV